MSPEPENTPMPGWSAALFSLIHPFKLAAVEAFLYIEEPMSGLLVYEVLGRPASFGTISYHVRRLAEVGVLVELYVEPRRGAHERFYGLAT
jgi:hypothetical protein